MRKAWGAALACAALLCAAPAHAARPRRRSALRRGDVGVVRRDDRPRQRAAGRHAQGRRHAQRPDLDDEHRRVHVERARRRAAGHHRPPRARRPAAADAGDARAAGAPPAERPVLQLVRPPHGREADDLAADRRPARAASSPRSTTAGWRSGCASWRAACRSCTHGRRAAVRLDGLRLLLPAGRQPDPVPLRARHGRRAVLLRHDRLGEPDRQLHRDREGRDPAAALLRRVPRVPGVLRLGVGRDAAVRLHAQLLRRARLRRRVPVRGHARDAVVGR